MKDIVKETLGRLFYIIPDYPCQAQIEITNRCNLTCAMCPRDHFKVLKEDMPLETFKMIISESHMGHVFNNVTKSTLYW